MVLGLAKWAYNLGVAQERKRIASELQVRAATYRRESDVYSTALRDGDFKKRDKERLERQAVIVKEIENLIHSLFHGEAHVTSSFLFPDDNIEKELNK